MSISFVSWEANFPQLSLKESKIIYGRVRSGKTFAKTVENICEDSPELILNHICIQFGRAESDLGYMIYISTICAVHLGGMLV